MIVSAYPLARAMAAALAAAAQASQPWLQLQPTPGTRITDAVLMILGLRYLFFRCCIASRARASDSSIIFFFRVFSYSLGGTMARVQVAVAIGLVLVSTYVTYARATAGDASMRDPPYVVPAAAGSVRYLDSNAGIQWTFHGVAEDGGSNAADAIPTKPTPATVPGDLLSDLHNAGFMPPPLHGTTWLLNRTVWDGATWYWTASFATASPEPGEGVLLVLDGVKMGAHVYLNGIQLDSGGVTDQFLRVSFPISQHLAPVGKNNTLVVEVPPPGRGDIPTNGRFMASTGGWDWAPHSNLTDKAGALTFTRGIWKSVSLVRVTAGAAAIAEVGVDVGYLGSYPAAPLSDADHDAFNITLSVSLYCPTPIAGTLAIGGNWTSKSNAMTVSLPAGTSTHTIWLNDDTESARLWWPVRMGEQPLYSVTTSFTPAASENDAAAVHASRAIGFRVFNLVTANSSIPGELQGVDGSGNFTMRWRINGADVFARGGNMIPMEELDALVDAEALTRLVQSAADGGMNTLRLWGGGIWQYEPWYEAADAAGMLIYHDAMYAQAGHSPTADATQKAEIEYQVRRLSHHPSIVVWDACNECRSKGSDVYASFVSTTIARTNPSNVVWPSCPSNGWTSGVDRLTGLPNGKPLIAAGAQVSAGYRAVGADGGSCGAFQENTDYDHGLISPHPAAADAGACCALCAAEPSCDVGVLYQGECWLKPHNVTPHVPSFRSGAVACWPSGKGPVPPTPSPGPEPAGYHEFHGPYTAGSGHASVVSSPVLTLFNPNTPPVLPPQYDVGPFERGHFRSEFGASVMSSFESISTFLDASDWGLHSAPMFQHNWVCDSTILSVFGKDIDLSGIGEEAFKKQLYLCTLAQALYIASSIEAYRGTNSFGIVIWQLNEIWPTGGKLSIPLASQQTATLSITLTRGACGRMGLTRIWNAFQWPGHRWKVEAAAQLARATPVRGYHHFVWRGRKVLRAIRRDRSAERNCTVGAGRVRRGQNDAASVRFDLFPGRCWPDVVVLHSRGRNGPEPLRAAGDDALELRVRD